MRYKAEETERKRENREEERRQRGRGKTERKREDREEGEDREEEGRQRGRGKTEKKREDREVAYDYVIQRTSSPSFTLRGTGGASPTKWSRQRFISFFKASNFVWEMVASMRGAHTTVRKSRPVVAHLGWEEGRGRRGGGRGRRGGREGEGRRTSSRTDTTIG